MRVRSISTRVSRFVWRARSSRRRLAASLFKEIVPDDIPYSIINQVMDKKALGELIDQAYRRLGNKATVLLADRLRTLGYTHATAAGISICVDDMTVPPDKERFIGDAEGAVREVESQYLEEV